MLQKTAALRRSDGMGRAAGASFGRGKAQGQSPGRPPGPAPRPDQPSWRRSPPDCVLGDSLKSQSRSAPPARAFQRTLSCDWRGGWLRPPRGRKRRKAGGRLRANSRPVRRAAPKRPKEPDPQVPARSNVGRWQRLRKRTAQAGREEPKRAGDGNSRSGGAPEAVADLRAEAAAATEAGPPV
ncbi:hypothetical protein AB1E18_013954 [Capra hircus]